MRWSTSNAPHSVQFSTRTNESTWRRTSWKYILRGEKMSKAILSKISLEMLQNIYYFCPIFFQCAKCACASLSTADALYSSSAAGGSMHNNTIQFNGLDLQLCNCTCSKCSRTVSASGYFWAGNLGNFPLWPHFKTCSCLQPTRWSHRR